VNDLRDSLLLPKKLEGEKRKGGGDREERTPEIEMQLKLIYIILTLCVSFLIFRLVR